MAIATPNQIPAGAPTASSSATGTATPPIVPQGNFARAAKIADKTGKKLSRTQAPNRPMVGKPQVTPSGVRPGISDQGMRRMQELFPGSDLSQLTDKLGTSGQGQEDMVNSALQAGMQAQGGALQPQQGQGQPQVKQANQATKQAQKPQGNPDIDAEIVKALSKRLNG